MDLLPITSNKFVSFDADANVEFIPKLKEQIE